VRGWLAVVPAVLVAAVVLAACGSGGSSTAAGSASGAASSSASASRGQFGAAFQAYTGCLTQHGVTLPSRGPRAGGFPSGPRPSAFPSGVRPSGFRPGFGGGFFGSTAPSGVAPSAWASATKACASLRPSFAAPSGALATALAAYLSCLKDHGVTATGTGFGALRSLKSTDPTVAKAMKTCAPLLPSRSPGARPSSVAG